MAKLKMQMGSAGMFPDETDQLPLADGASCRNSDAEVIVNADVTKPRRMVIQDDPRWSSAVARIVS